MGAWRRVQIICGMDGRRRGALTERGGETVEEHLAENDVTVEKEVWIMMEGGRVFDWRGGGVAA